MNYIKALNMLDFDFEDVHRDLEETEAQWREFVDLEREYAEWKGRLETVYHKRKASLS